MKVLTGFEWLESKIHYPEKIIDYCLKQEPNKPTIIRGQIKGLEPGMHGIHIHEFGDLSDGCDSAGGHYNPDGVDHGDLMQGHVGSRASVLEAMKYTFGEVLGATGKVKSERKAEKLKSSMVKQY